MGDTWREGDEDVGRAQKRECPRVPPTHSTAMAATTRLCAGMSTEAPPAGVVHERGGREGVVQGHEKSWEMKSFVLLDRRGAAHHQPRTRSPQSGVSGGRMGCDPLPGKP